MRAAFDWQAHDLSRDSIQKKLALAETSPVVDPFPEGFFSQPPHPAAVLIPIFLYRSRWNFLFIRRTVAVNDRHAGQVAFPGGRADETDESPEATAMRESHEEVGIGSLDVEVLGRLGAYHTISNYLVTPVVGLISWPKPLRLAPLEVARAFSIPLDWLADPANYRILYPALPGTELPHEVIFYRHYAGELLWGITARIVRTFIQLFFPLSH
jgi:8-oxo-dGTP pyrophosphatase MutT (NUDIX family)